MIPLIHITADEVNHIIYSYLHDSGFEHTAFNLRIEGRLEQSAHFNDYIPRGQLVELLTKALLYIEVETHCKGDGLITDCKTPFSLLKKHACAIDTADDSMNGVTTHIGGHAGSNGTTETLLKRKAIGPADGDVQDRRVKRSVEPEISTGKSVPGSASSAAPSMPIVVTPSPLPDAVPMDIVPTNGEVKKKVKKKVKPRATAGPGDDDTPLQAILTIPGHSAEIFVCAFNPVFPQKLATGSKDATVRIWDLPDPPDDASQFAGPPEKPPIVLKHLPMFDPMDITTLTWSPDGKLLATGSYDCILRIWTSSGEVYFTHSQHQGPIFANQFSKSGRWLLTGSLDGTVCLWDMTEKKLSMQFRCHTECCLDVNWIDDRTFASCGADKLIHLMQIGRQTPLHTFEGHESEVNQIKFNSSRTLLASCSDDNTARIWTLGSFLANSSELESIPGLGTGVQQQQQKCLVLSGHTDSVNNIQWCSKPPEGMNELVATASFNGMTRLWDASTGDCLQSHTDHTRSAYALAFSPDGKFFASGGGDGWLYIYSVETGRLLWSWFAGCDKPGIYEMDWQRTGKLNRISLCLESRNVCVIDVTRIPALMV